MFTSQDTYWTQSWEKSNRNPWSKIFEQCITTKYEDNQICDEGVGFLAEALKNHTTLVSLHLGSNKIGITGTQYLSNVLRNNTKIRRIYLENNEIADEGVQFLSEALANNE
ncbi:unnamed protein product, partial [Rotaria magnacalcarata]